MDDINIDYIKAQVDCTFTIKNTVGTVERNVYIEVFTVII